MKDYTIRFSGNSLAEMSDVMLRLAEEPEGRPTGTEWNVSRSGDEQQMEALISGVSDPAELREALRLAAQRVEEARTTGHEEVRQDVWVQLKPFK